MSAKHSNFRKSHLIALALVALLGAGCSGSIVGPGAAPQLYLLRAAANATEGPKVTWALSVTQPEATDNLDTQRIALFNPPTRMDYYANASWPDRLPALVQSATVQAFEQSGRIVGVASDDAGLKSDYTLQIALRDFNAVYASPDAVPTFRIHLTAKLVRTRSRVIVQTLDVVQDVPAGANTVDNVVIAANQGLSAALKQIVDWALAAPPLPPPAPAS